jgi:hypothetical protein
MDSWTDYGWMGGGGWGRFDILILSDLQFMSHVFLFIGELHTHLMGLGFESMSSPSTHTLVRGGRSI